MATAKTIEQLNEATQINATDQMALVQESGKEAVRGSVQMLAGAVADINETGALSELVYATSQGKQALVTALVNKGVSANSNDTLIELADKVNNLSVDASTEIMTAYAFAVSFDSSSTAVRGGAFCEGFRNVLLENNTLYMVEEGEYDSWEEMIAGAVASIQLTNTYASFMTVNLDKSKVLVLTKDTDNIYHVEIFNIDWAAQQITAFKIVTPSSSSGNKLTATSVCQCNADASVLAWTESKTGYPTCFFWDIAQGKYKGQVSSGNGGPCFIMDDDYVYEFSSDSFYYSPLYDDLTANSDLSSSGYGHHKIAYGSEYKRYPFQIFAHNNGAVHIPGTSKVIFLGTKEADKEISSSATFSARRLTYYVYDLNTRSVIQTSEVKELMPYLIRQSYYFGSSSGYPITPGVLRIKKREDGQFEILHPYFSQGVLVYDPQSDTITFDDTEVKAMFVYASSSNSNSKWTPLCKTKNGGFLIINTCDLNAVSLIDQIGTFYKITPQKLVAGFKRKNLTGGEVFAVFPYMTSTSIKSGAIDYDTQVIPAVAAE